jgi:vacuolar-type H+-ATPase subunit F/Vma7
MRMTYLGPPGSGLGFKLAGMTIVECADSDALVRGLEKVSARDGGVFFIDEGLAENALSGIEHAGERLEVTIVLVANSAVPKRLAARKMENLMIQAVGSDIFKNS